MKALSIRAPWWWMILYGGKDIENRSRPFSYRGPVLLHASKWFSAAEVQRALDFAPASYVQKGGVPPLGLLQARCGHIVGVADIVDCVQVSRSAWFHGPYGLVLANVRQVDPYPVRGMLGLFDAPAPKELAHG